MKSIKLKVLFLLLLVITSCSQQVELDTDFTPLLQIDAVFFSGEPIPHITIRKSYNIDRKDITIIDSTEIYVVNASVDLYKNGSLITLSESFPGIYIPESQDTVKQGDIFEITVNKDGLQASAIAQVPVYPTDDIQVLQTNEDPLTSSEAFLSALNRDTTQENDSLFWFMELPITMTIPFIPHLTAINFYSNSSNDIINNYWINYPNIILDRFEFTRHNTYLSRDLQGFEEITVTKNLPVFKRAESELPTKFSEVIHYSVIIPEPIYETYLNTISDVFVPVTVTNVEGGLGLFIGAIKKEDSVIVTFDVTE